MSSLQQCDILLKHNICCESITAMCTTHCCLLIIQKSGFYSYTYC